MNFVKPLTQYMTGGPQKRQRPKISTIDRFRNVNFYGREEDLTTLHNKLSPEEAAGRTEGELDQHPTFYVVHGLPGVGKTQLALEYAHRFENSYDALFWLPSEKEPELQNHFARIARRLRHFDPSFQRDEHSRQEPHEAVRDWLQCTGRPPTFLGVYLPDIMSECVWLLIFDNMEDISDIERHIPHCSRTRGSILLTTQNPNFRKLNDAFYKLRISSFDQQASVEMLFKYLERQPVNDTEHSAAAEMTDFFGGLPIAIATIAGAIKEAQSSPMKFLPVCCFLFPLLVALAWNTRDHPS